MGTSVCQKLARKGIRIMSNPRRSSYSISQTSDSPFHFHDQIPYFSSIKQFLKKPHAFPLLLSIFLFLTWVSLRLQHSSQFSSSPVHITESHQKSSREDDLKANLVRFSSGMPSRIVKDKRGWLLNPVSLARDSGISGGAVTCSSVHVGEIRPGSIRANHRHHDCNETFLIWGAKTKFRLENKAENYGYAEVIIGEDEVAVAACPHGIAHALVNVDSIRNTFFIGCQDDVATYNSSSTDFNVWKDV